MTTRFFVTLLAVLIAAGVAVMGTIYFIGKAKAETGLASNYGRGDGYAGKCVAMQKPGGGCARLNVRAMTAAHRTLPFGTAVMVHNKRNGRSVRVVINDRGPFIAGRIIDLSPAAADALGCPGLCPVSVN